MGFLASLGKVGEKVSDVVGEVGMYLGGAGAAVAVTGIGLPLAGLLEAGAGLAGTISVGGKGVAIAGSYKTYWTSYSIKTSNRLKAQQRGIKRKIHVCTLSIILN